MDEAIAVPDISTLTSDKVQKCQAQIRFVIHTNTIFRCGQTDLKAGPREKVVARLASYRAELARQEEQVSSVAVNNVNNNVNNGHHYRVSWHSFPFC